MSATLVTPKTTSGGEIIRELVNSSDGQGLHFDGSGYVSAGDTTVIDGATKLSVEVIAATTAADDGEMIAKAHAATALRFYVNTSGQVVFRVNNGSGNGTATSSGTVNDGNPTHIVGVWDGSNVKIYINGNEDGSAALSGGAVPNIADKLALGTQLSTSDGTANSFTGTLYRARIWNKAVDAKALFERADVPVADQYGSQTELVDNGDFASTSGWSENNVTIAGDGNAVWAVSGGDQWVRRADWNITAGKKYRITVVSSAHTTNGSFQVFTYGATATIATTDVNGDAFTISGTGTHIFEFEALADSDSGVLFGRYPTGAEYVGTFTDLSCVQIGAVVDLDLAFANENQSRMVADRSTNNVDGEMSSSGVKQTQVIKQLNSTAMRIGGTSATAATPADGQLIIGAGGSGGTASAHADELLIDNNGNSGITIASGASDYGGINFSDSGNNSAGIVRYDHSDNSLKLYTQTTERLTIDSSGKTTATATTTDSSGLVDTLQIKNGGTSAGDGGKLLFTAGTSTNGAGIGSTGQALNSADLKFYTGGSNERLHIHHSTGLCTFSAGIVSSEKGIMSGSVVVADEGVATITPTRSGGFLEVHANTDDGTTGLYPLSNYSTKIFFDSGSSPANAKITTAIGADVDLTTSDVTGTTGTNGKVTIATLSNVIKIENQQGGAVKFFYTITC